jgi:hypothetical protein
MCQNAFSTSTRILDVPNLPRMCRIFARMRQNAFSTSAGKSDVPDFRDGLPKRPVMRQFAF